jgi:hypothetical protein
MLVTEFHIRPVSHNKTKILYPKLIYERKLFKDPHFYVYRWQKANVRWLSHKLLTRPTIR